MIRKAIVVFVYLFGFLQLQAQESKELSLTTVLKAVTAENAKIKIANSEVRMLKGAKKETNAFFLPTVSISHTGISTTNPLMVFGTKLNQGIVKQTDFTPSLLNNPDAIQNYNTKINIMQPIVNVDGFYARKAIQNQVNASEFSAQRVQDHILLEAKNTYAQLQLAYKVEEIVKTILNATLENKKTVDNYVAEGLLQESDALEVEVRLIEIKNQLQYAESNIKNISGKLSILMNTSREMVYKPVGELKLNETKKMVFSISEERSDIKAMSEMSKAYVQMNKANKSHFLPSLNAFGSYDWNGDQIFNSNKGGYTMGFALQWNLFEGGSRLGRVQKSKAKAEKSLTQYQDYVAESQLELARVQRAFSDVTHKINLAKKAMTSAKEIYRIKQDRFKEGLEKIADLLQVEALFSQKQLAYHQSVYEYNTTLEYLKFLTKE
ncbi:TolC family protein [Pseudotenacibaculum haliotis]|uniref:TolC family protein n=1 Tax=Pseudotenacibaculum haliotis TaxID=1862138 RepID=A0ABW5LPT8_9FLAO